MTAVDWLVVEAISRGDRAAFIALFEFTSDAVRAEATARLPDTRRAGTVLAATYLEVWWLAGCYCGSGIDVVAWIGQILDRRIAEAGPRARPWTLPLPATADRSEPLRPSHAELELATLLGRPFDRLWPV